MSDEEKDGLLRACAHLLGLAPPSIMRTLTGAWLEMVRDRRYQDALDRIGPDDLRQTFYGALSDESGMHRLYWRYFQHLLVQVAQAGIAMQHGAPVEASIHFRDAQHAWETVYLWSSAAHVTVTITPTQP